MEVLDTSIANVALPHIAGGLSASQDESTWVLTSYLVSNAVILPISAWLSVLVGRKRFYMTCVALFTISSFLCGLAPTLGMLVLFRVMQGLGGGGLATSEQAILADTFSLEKRGMAFAVYGMAVVLAPAIGPTLGGWITDNYSWRWIFYINVPVGSAVALSDAIEIVEDPPYMEIEQQKTLRNPIDYMGLGLIARRHRLPAVCARQGPGSRLVRFEKDHRSAGNRCRCARLVRHQRMEARIPDHGSAAAAAAQFRRQPRS